MKTVAYTTKKQKRINLFLAIFLTFAVCFGGFYICRLQNEKLLAARSRLSALEEQERESREALSDIEKELSSFNNPENVIKRAKEEDLLMENEILFVVANPDSFADHSPNETQGE